MADEEKISFDISQIMKLIPHRYPFLLVDRITECVPGKYCKGYKNLTINEEFFQGHFPEMPIMPGVLQLEAMAQVSVGVLLPLEEYKGKLFLFAGVDKARFKQAVKPGDRLDMTSELLKIKGPVVKAHTQAFVDGKLVADAELMFSAITVKKKEE